MIKHFALMFIFLFMMISSSHAQEFKDGDRMIMIFGSKFCPPCLRLDQMIQGSEKIKKAKKEDYKNRLFVLKKEDSSKSPVVKAWFDVSKTYVRSFPSIVIYQKRNGKFHFEKMAVGYLDEAAFLNFIKMPK